MRRFLVTILLTFSTTLAPSVAEDPGRHGPEPAADARFEFLKGLAGTWVGQAAKAGTAGSLFEFRVTAGGHAVEEREMVGTPMEMLTVYHMDGKDLVATHYCMLGNQPRARARMQVDPNELTFECAGTPGNAESHEDEHVHGWSLRIETDGQLRYSGQIVKQSSVTEAPEFLLTRR